MVVATGRYRKLGVEDEDRFQGLGLFYAATEIEARPCKDKEVVAVGGAAIPPARPPCSWRPKRVLRAPRLPAATT